MDPGTTAKDQWTQGTQDSQGPMDPGNPGSGSDTPWAQGPANYVVIPAYYYYSRIKLFQNKIIPESNYYRIQVFQNKIITE